MDYNFRLNVMRACCPLNTSLRLCTAAALYKMWAVCKITLSTVIHVGFMQYSIVYCNGYDMWALCKCIEYYIIYMWVGTNVYIG